MQDNTYVCNGLVFFMNFYSLFECCPIGCSLMVQFQLKKLEKVDTWLELWSEESMVGKTKAK